nr:MAG TPA: hypothetical protein [Caudoviricetes sp.]
MTTTFYNYTPNSITLNCGEKYDSVGVARVSNTRPKPQFKPFEKVLVRDGDQYEWQCNFFSGMDKENFYLCVSARWEQCIPYEGNEHLLGTTNKPE